MMSTARSRSTPGCIRWLSASLLAVPTLSLAQESPFLTGATALQTNILAWMTPVAIILIMTSIFTASPEAYSSVFRIPSRRNCGFMCCKEGSGFQGMRGSNLNRGGVDFALLSP